MFVYKVILNIPHLCGLSYFHSEKLAAGSLVTVPVHNKIHAGIMLGIDKEYTDNNQQNYEIKKIIEVNSDINFCPEWLEMINFIAKYYHESLGETALGFIPKYIKNYKLWNKNKLSQSISNTKIDKILNSEKIKNKNLHSDKIELSNEQRNVLNNILDHKNNYNVHLLHGITGSGKTQIYLNLIENYLSDKEFNAQILILVPEINLTPQIFNTINARFPDALTVLLNSDVSEKQRAVSWYLAYTGLAKIIIGTRLSSTAVLPNLKLIIVDEEHDQSYKQQSGIRYHARDITIWRAKQLNIPIILGSATPSLESYHNALSGKYKYHVLNQKATNMALPHIHIIDMANYLQNQMAGNILSPPLMKAMHETLENKQQVLLFLNRRGFAPAMFCANCRYTFACKNCSVNLVFHKTTDKLHCHHCGYVEKLLNCCPSCNHTQILPIGTGTQRLSQILETEFASYKCLRIDSDSTSCKGSLETQMNIINNQEADIIIGTQMLSKGHDFKHVAMAGIIQPDGMLYSYNFRSSEHLFCQLMQVIGRAGRHSQNSHVFIQTMFPKHKLFHALQKHSYTEYAEILLKERQELGIMPFAFEAHIYASHMTSNKAKQELEALYSCILELAKNYSCLITPPNYHTMLKKNGAERAYMIIENASRKNLHKFIDEVLPYIRAMRCEWYIEIY